ncbi:MAG: prohibitin family protein [Candidatus Micrarchaeota archaeon]
MKSDKWDKEVLRPIIKNSAGGSKLAKWMVNTILFAAVIVILLSVFQGAFIASIPAGHVGVMYDSFAGGVQAAEWPEGLHIKMPWQSITMYSIRTQDYTMSIVQGEGDVENADSIDALTKEGLTVKLDMTVLYKVVPDKASDIHQTIGIEYRTVVIRPTIRTAIRDVAAKYDAKDIYSSNRQAIANEINGRLKAEFNEKGIILETVLLRNVILPQKVASAIEEKLEAEQQAQRMVFILDKETQEAERKKIEAGGIAAAQKIIDSTLTTQYLTRYWIENLDKHQDVIYVPVGENGMPIFKKVEDSVDVK